MDEQSNILILYGKDTYFAKEFIKRNPFECTERKKGSIYYIAGKGWHIQLCKNLKNLDSAITNIVDLINIEIYRQKRLIEISKKPDLTCAFNK